MAAPGDTYERELKYLLSGDRKTIERMNRTCSEEERAAYSSMIDEPFLVIRAAGSLGVDLVALRWDFSFPIEVKSSCDGVLHFSRNPRLSEQAERMRDECRDSHLLPIYAMRQKSVRGDPWRVFALPMDGELRGNMGLLQRRVPKLAVSPGGNYIMKWELGMKLSDFISYVGMSEMRGAVRTHRAHHRISLVVSSSGAPSPAHPRGPISPLPCA